MATEAAQKAAILAILPGVTFTTPSPTRAHASIAAGDVISMDPPEGTLVAPDAVITLTISSGPAEILLSRFTGTNAAVLDAVVATTAEERHIMPVVFVDLDIPGDRLRLSDAGIDIPWGGYTWNGLGKFGAIEAIAETIEVIAQPVRLTLSGVDPAVVSDVLDTVYQGEAVTIYVGFLDNDTATLHDDPEEVWGGTMDVMTIDVNKGLATVQVDCEHRLRRMPSASRYTDESQRSLFSGDTYFDHLWQVREVRKWGASDVQHSSGSGSGGGRFDRGGGGRLQ